MSNLPLRLRRPTEVAQPLVLGALGKLGGLLKCAWSGISTGNAFPDDNVMEGNFFGVSADGASALGGFQDGIFLGGTADRNRVGGTTSAARNVVAGATWGLRIQGQDTLVQGNFFGTDSSGTAPLPNARGIHLAGATGTVVGGSDEGADGE